MGFQPNYQSEGRIYAKYILDNFPNSKIAVLWQNDDAGKDQFKGLKDGLGDKANMIIADKSYEVSDPTHRFADRRVARFRRRHLLLLGRAEGLGAGDPQGRRTRTGSRNSSSANTATSVASVLKPAGLQYAKDIISTAYLKDPTDPTWDKDPAVDEVARVHGQVLSRTATRPTPTTSTATCRREAMVQVLKQCGDNLTRENVMKQAANLKNFHSDLMLPGIMVNTGAGRLSFRSSRCS